MAQIQLSVSQTGATTLTQVNAQSYPSIILSADNLAAAEEVDIYYENGKVVTDSSGTAIKLTATITAVPLLGGVIYFASKDVTAGACALFMAPAARVY